MLIKCAYCSGSGEHPRKHQICPVCNGSGKNDVPSDHVSCAYCSGSGEHPQKYQICPACSGTGVVKPSRYR